MKTCTIICAIVLLFTWSGKMFAQLAPGIYLVEFIDKANNEYALSSPEKFLSERALERRTKQGIVIDSSDLPITRTYLDSLHNMGFRILCTSRWMNSAVVEPSDEMLLFGLDTISFIKSRSKSAIVRKMRELMPKLESTSSIDVASSDSTDYGVAWQQIHFHHGEALHDLGYRGKGIQIAVIDAGFYNANIQPSLVHLWERGQFLAARDIIDPTTNVYTDHSHGMSVLSIMAGNDPFNYVGTAPDASYYLIRSEQSASEYIIEEDYWIAAAEFADSAGADVINSSLGYTTFQNPFQDHIYADMNGTTRVSRGAEMAFSKGMMVVVSAGNLGNSEWQYISAPSDAMHVLSVGAANFMGKIGSFSSRGPSSDGRIKPDITSVGWNTWVQNYDGTYASGSGTSFSAPVIAGLTACLWQANPTLSNLQLRSCILQSCPGYYTPDTIYGYGIPDFYRAHQIARSLIQWPEERKDSVFLSPNPFTDQLHLSWYDESAKQVEIALYTLSGNCMIKKTSTLNPGPVKNFTLEGLEFIPSGIYIIKIKAESQHFNFKVVKQ